MSAHIADAKPLKSNDRKGRRFFSLYLYVTYKKFKFSDSDISSDFLFDFLSNISTDNSSNIVSEDETNGPEIDDLSMLEQQSEYCPFLNGAYDYDMYNEWLEEQNLPYHRESFQEDMNMSNNSNIQKYISEI